VEWRLKVYPKGNGLAREKYLSVFVEMSKALGAQNKYEYRIELVNPSEPSLTVKREYCSTFEIGECWGTTNFSHWNNCPSRNSSRTTHCSLG
jgi:tripartite motif-containing protein 37